MYNYDDIFDWFLLARSLRIGVKEIQDFSASLLPGSSILDLGCGYGKPVTEILVDHGYNVYAIDSSDKMVQRFHETFPNLPVRCEPIQQSDFFNRQFDAVVAWGVLFHLTENDQQLVIAKVAQALKSGGRFFFTSSNIVVTDNYEMNGVPFPYISLGYDTYAALLQKNGMKLTNAFVDEGDNYIYISEKIS